jgi:simple sugar transport system permease protein
VARPSAPKPWFLRIEGLPIIAVLAILILAFIISAPEVFLGFRIYLSFFATLPPILLLSVGLTLVVAAGEIDLSFPSIVALSGYLLAVCMHELNDTPLAPVAGWLGFVLAMAAGALVGYVNGVIVARIGIPSIIATLATQFFWGGVTTVISNGLSYSLREADKFAVWHLFVGRIGNLPAQAIWALVVSAILWVILNRHRFGEHILFIGDNAAVAQVVGVDVAREKIRLFVLMGVVAAFSAVLLTLENKNFFNTQGSSYLLEALAAVFIGGTSVFGGQATVVGTVAGALIIGMVEAGLVATGLQGFWVRAVVGIVFLIAVVFHLLMERPDRRSALFRMIRGPFSRGGA